MHQLMTIILWYVTLLGMSSLLYGFVCTFTNNLFATSGTLSKINISNIFSHLFSRQKFANFRPWQAATKRFLDVLAASILLTFSLPFLCLLAILIKLDSKGPVIYSQERIGLHRQPFRIYKLRTMYIDAEKDGPKNTEKNDPRITRIGKWLRKMRLDEFPQFFNVLRGDMSFVGPRPERMVFIQKIEKQNPKYNELLYVRPGITGLAQIRNGYAVTIKHMLRRLQYDRWYIQNRTLRLDFKILWKSLFIILKQVGH